MDPNLNQTHIFISLVIAFITLFFIYIFRPFVEIYLLHFLKIQFLFSNKFDFNIYNIYNF